ncbi:MAG TPA: TonB-dependent receptor [Caulobacteraceae bacterium]|jgi:outer membrane receptor protein involved in Fe transport|nr:TonB-dependent receptor [Caulobacteraceae bacterium]
MHLPTLLLASASLIALAASAQAQTVPGPLSEIVVTAEKREARLQETPISVTVLSAQRLQDAGVRDIKDLAVVTPGLLVASTSNATYTTARIRGVGTVGDNPGLESSVGVAVDGVMRPRNGVALTDLGEIDRIEVLKGPQGTLFGKNTSAGVIGVLTAPPSSTFSAAGEATAGEHGTWGGSASVTGPLSQTVSARLYGAVRQRDGYYGVRTGAGPRTETRDDDQDLWTLRGQLAIAASPKASLRLIADYTRREENCCVGVQLNVGPSARYLAGLAPDGGVAQGAADPWARVAYSNRGTAEHIHDGGVSAQADIDLGWGRLTSLTAWREWKASLGQDWDFTSVDVAYRPDDGSFSNRFRTLSQELRLAGTSGRLDWLVGGYYQHETLNRRDRFLYGTDYERYLSLVLTGGANANSLPTTTGRAAGTIFPAGQGLDDRYDQREESVAVFTHQTLRLTDRFSLSAGLRYTDEHKRVVANFSNSDAGAGCAAAQAQRAASVATLCLPWSNPAFNNLAQTQKLTEGEWSGSAQALYRAGPAASLYASYARGYKAGGFNLDRSQTGLVPDASTAFARELVDDYEVGAKTSWLGGALLLNAALFEQDYSHFQLNTFLGTTFTVRSIPKVTAKGLDLDFLYRTPMAGLTLQGGVVHAQTEYGPDAIAGLPRLSGSRLSFAPLWSASLGAALERPVGAGLTARASADVKYSSSYNTGSDLDPLKVQTGFALVNARVGVGAADGAWRLELWAQNLFDQHYVQVAFGAPFQTGTIGAFLGAPRTLGATLRVATR